MTFARGLLNLMNTRIEIFFIPCVFGLILGWINVQDVHPSPFGDG